MDADLLGELPLVEPRVPELTNELIDLGLVAAPARTLDVMHPSLSPGSKQIGNYGIHRTLTAGQREERGQFLILICEAPKALSRHGRKLRVEYARTKGDPVKVALAARLRAETTMTVGWIAEAITPSSQSQPPGMNARVGGRPLR